MEQLANETLQSFLLRNPQLGKYEPGRATNCVNPIKLAILYSGELEIAKVVMFDFLYLDGRAIYIPYFDVVINSKDTLAARMQAHCEVERLVSAKTGVSDLVSKYTDAYPQCFMYWDALLKEVIPKSTIATQVNVPSHSAAKCEQQSLF